MRNRIASIKETGEELSQAEWERFDAAVAAFRTERRPAGRTVVEPIRREDGYERSFHYEESAPVRP